MDSNTGYSKENIRYSNSNEVVPCVIRLDKVENNSFRKSDIRARPEVLAFGGRIVGQSLAAAVQAIEAGFLLNSIHSYFLLPVTAKYEETCFKVKTLHSSSHFCRRMVVARRGGHVVFVAIISFHIPEPLTAPYWLKMPAAADPETLKTSREVLNLNWDNLTEEQRRSLEKNSSADEVLRLDVRRANYQHPAMLEPIREVGDKLLFWIRLKCSLKESTYDQNVQRCLFGYLSDYTNIVNSLLFMDMVTNKLKKLTSLDHNVWFCGNISVTDWMLCQCENPQYVNNRVLLEAHYWNRKGELLATVAQEALIRLESRL